MDGKVQGEGVVLRGYVLSFIMLQTCQALMHTHTPYLFTDGCVKYPHNTSHVVCHYGTPLNHSCNPNNTSHTATLPQSGKSPGLTPPSAQSWLHALTTRESTYGRRLLLLDLHWTTPEDSEGEAPGMRRTGEDRLDSGRRSRRLMHMLLVVSDVMPFINKFQRFDLELCCIAYEIWRISQLAFMGTIRAWTHLGLCVQ